jgi:hypothetical protein
VWRNPDVRLLPETATIAPLRYLPMFNGAFRQDLPEYLDLI